MTAINAQISFYLVLGITLIYCTKRRRFERTTIHGTEQYQSYRHKVKSKMIDALLWGLGIGGFLSATLLTFMEYAPAWGFLVLVLVAAFAIEKDCIRKAYR